MTARNGTRAASLVAFTALITIAAYLPSMQGPFVWDDLGEIAENPAMRTLFPPWRPMFEGGELPHRPIPYLTFAMNYALGRLLGDPLDTLPFHAVNVLVHLANGAILAWIVLHILTRQPSTTGTQATSAGFQAWLSATLWLVHPLQSQAVSYIYQRIELLAALAALATFAAFLKAAATGRPFPWMITAVIACSLGMACKEWGLVVPLVVLLADRTLLAGSWREVLARRGSWHAALFATIPILFVVVASQRSRYPETSFSAWQAAVYAFNQPSIILWYLSRLMMPWGQSLDHGGVVRQEIFGRDAWLLLPLSGLLTAVGWAIWSLPRRPTTAFMILAFLLLLAPTSSILPVQDVCVEHRMYLAAAIPIVAAVTLAASHVRPLIPAGILLAIVLAGITASRNTVYRSAVAIWQDAVAKNGGSSRSLSRLGAELSKLDRHAEAVAAGEAAVARNPINPVPYAALAAALINADRLEEAAVICRAGLATAPPHEPRSFADPVLDRLALYHGIALDRLGDPGGEPLLREAVARRPESLVAREHLARALLHSDPRESAVLWAALVSQSPEDAHLLFNLGSALARFDPAQAVGILSRAVALDPHNPDAFNNLGNVLLMLDRRDGAARAYRQCLELMPDHPQAAANLRALGEADNRSRMAP
jgi:protein O-mannosyl-transferase